MAYLTEQQITALRVHTNELPDRKAIAPTYPGSRNRGSITLPSGQKLITPTPMSQTGSGGMRVFPFNVPYIGQRRQAFSLARCVGPGRIVDFFWAADNGQSPPSQTIEVGYALAPILENQVVLATPRSYTCLTEGLDPFSVGQALRGHGYPIGTIPTHTAFAIIPLGFDISASEFYPVIAIVNNSAAAGEVNGWIRVAEGVTPGSSGPF